MITVFGSINMDLVTPVPRLPGPGETIPTTHYETYAGGKGANQALAAARAGAQVALVGSVGNDGFAEPALAPLAAAGIDLSQIARRDGHTGLAMISVDPAGENLIVAANGVNLETTASQLDSSPASATTLLLQMETAPEENWIAIRHAQARGVRTILNVAPAAEVPKAILRLLDIVIVNETEILLVAGAFGPATDDPESAALRLVEAGVKTVIVTLGAAGAAAYTTTGSWRVGVPQIEVVDSVGAGDSFVGALAAALDDGADLAAALHRAAIAGSLACRRRGAQTSIPHAAEIDAWIDKLAPPVWAPA
ncbi:MAG: PfkB family carbohydrate kinase [Proteobacteria bacterium]|nr:PfkB family carbohydrate kinase [Pseudomonadota bacterium]